MKIQIHLRVSEDNVYIYIYIYIYIIKKKGESKLVTRKVRFGHNILCKKKSDSIKQQI
jgi:hypothetical protein